MEQGWQGGLVCGNLLSAMMEDLAINLINGET